MDAISEKRITRNLVFIKDNITQLSRVMDKLIELDEICMDEKADILTEKGTDIQCDLLLQTLMKRGGNAFNSFVEALKISGNGHVAEKLLQRDFLDDLNRNDTFLEIDDRQDEIIQLIKDRELYKMKLNELKSKYTSLKHAHEEKSKEVDSLAKDMDVLRSKVSSAEQKCATVEKDNRQWRKVKNRLCEFEQKGASGKDDIDGFEKENGRPSVADIDPGQLISKLEKQTVTIEELTKCNEYYSNQVDILQDQVEDLKASLKEKDLKIMDLRNSVGKLQIHIASAKQERERMLSELRKEMNKSNKENEERFEKLNGKIDTVISLIAGNASKSMEINSVKSPRNLKMKCMNKKIGR